MAFDDHVNLAVTTVSSAPANTGDTNITFDDGTVFPAVPFNVTLWPTGANPEPTNAEIGRVTALNTGTGVATMLRAQEGTTARNIATAWNVAATITAKTLQDIEAGNQENLIIAAQVFS